VAADFRQWYHGYVVTSHKAQGWTADHVAAKRLTSKGTHVACSRGRRSCTIHTPEKARMIERLPEGNRRAALDALSETRSRVPLTRNSCPVAGGKRGGLHAFFVLVMASYLMLAGCAHRASSLPELAPDVFGQLYLPGSPSLHPAVVVLHGSGGMRPGYHREAAFLAAHGYAALVLDYYAKVQYGGVTRAERAQRWQDWEASVRAALAYLAQHPAIDRSRLALVGFSQGAALALTTAIETADVGAVVDYFGPSVAGWYISRFIGYGRHLPENWLDRLPPVLILHGARDPIVSVADSRKLDAALQRRGKIVELHVYPDSMHALNDPKSGSEKAQATAQDARERALRFLDTHLAPGTVEQ
jgi:dienelactone hydrolase